MMVCHCRRVNDKAIEAEVRMGALTTDEGVLHPACPKSDGGEDSRASDDNGPVHGLPPSFDAFVRVM